MGPKKFKCRKHLLRQHNRAEYLRHSFCQNGLTQNKFVSRFCSISNSPQFKISIQFIFFSLLQRPVVLWGSYPQAQEYFLGMKSNLSFRLLHTLRRRRPYLQPPERLHGTVLSATERSKKCTLKKRSQR